MNNGFFNLVSRPNRDIFDDLFGLANAPWSSRLASDSSAFMPSVDVQETPKYWALMVDVPGVKREDLKIDVEGLNLTISGQRQSVQDENRGKDGENEGTWSHVERRFGSFSRRFSLPETAETEAIRADHRDGVLKILIPKKAVAAKKTIEIGSD